MQQKQDATFLSPHLGPQMNISQSRVLDSRITKVGVGKTTACYTLYTIDHPFINFICH